MSLQKTFLWPHSKNLGETFEGWATESRQLSASLRQMLARRTFASDGGSSLPTPKANTLATNGLWPTPNVPNGGRSIAHATWKGGTAYHNGRKVQVGLHAAVKATESMWPTPTATSYGRNKGGANPDGPERPSLGTMASQGLWTTLCDTVHGTGGKLSPLWVEWLMGWPIGWTGCEPLATDKCRWPQRPLGTT
jgi:hypothetical protein